jgi:hypothetical protein
MKMVLITALLTACLLPGIASAHNSRALGNSNMIGSNFKIVIPAIVHIAATRQNDTFTIKPRDLAQGYVDLDQATVLRGNGKMDCEVSAAVDPLLISHVASHSGTREFRVIPSEGGLVVGSAPSPELPLSITYRLFLRGNAAVGEHPWPLFLKFTCRAA